ncbi:MAG TPA: MFS transporter [Gemmatimonadales bacterium]|nr:MFS transporter [Gemmatimonadales bacterium]
MRAGESGTALLLMLNVFLILTAYYVMRVVREPLIVASGGAEVRSYSAAGQAVVLLLLVPAYGWLASRVPRRRLINVVTAAFAACLVAFYLLARAGVPVGVVFYIWLGVFNVMMIAQFWAFANDVYTNDEGKRLFPIVGFGASSGAVLGAWLAGQLAGPVGIHQLLLVAAVILVVAAGVTNLLDARERKRTEAAVPDVRSSGVLPAATGQVRSETGEFQVPTGAYAKESGHFKTVRPDQTEPEDDVGSTGNAFQLVFRNRYLLLIALLVVLLNWVNTNGEYILSRTVIGLAERAAAQDPTGAVTAETQVLRFYSGFQTAVALAGLLIQLFLTSRVIRYLGVAPALLVLPCIALAGYTLMAFVPLLMAIRWAKTLENATDYSLQNTVRNVLFLPTTREEKYKAKQVTDGVSQRLGDVLHAATVLVGTGLLAIGVQQFAVFNLVLVVVWLAVAVMVGRRYKRLVAVLT